MITDIYSTVNNFMDRKFAKPRINCGAFCFKLISTVIFFLCHFAAFGIAINTEVTQSFAKIHKSPPNSLYIFAL